MPSARPRSKTRPAASSDPSTAAPGAGAPGATAPGVAAPGVTASDDVQQLPASPPRTTRPLTEVSAADLSPSVPVVVGEAPGYRARRMRDRRFPQPAPHGARRGPASSGIGGRSGAGPTGAGLSGTGVIGRLTPRDWWLLAMLLEHRVLTTTQVAQLAFGTVRQAAARLLTLTELGVLQRFRPATATGSAPHHYHLAPLGLQVIAEHAGVPRSEVDQRQWRLPQLAVSLHLAHTVGANSVFTALAAQARTLPGAALTAWWSERRCLRAWNGLIRPDGYGRWHDPHHDPHNGLHGDATSADPSLPGQLPPEVDFFLEYDTGTENLNRVVGKLPGFARLTSESGLCTPILFWLHSPQRETHLRQRIWQWHQATAHPPLLIATTSTPTTTPTTAPITVPITARFAVTTGPADPVWQPLLLSTGPDQPPSPSASPSSPRRGGSPGGARRVRLIELAAWLPAQYTAHHRRPEDLGLFVTSDASDAAASAWPAPAVDEAPDPRPPRMPGAPEPTAVPVYWRG